MISLTYYNIRDKIQSENRGVKLLKTNRKEKQKHGISLIILVITIIIMIILAAAVILALNSSNIINKANEAKASNDIAIIQKEATVKLAEYELKKADGVQNLVTPKLYIEEQFSTKNGYDFNYYANEKGMIVGTKHIEGEITVPIPLGFTESNLETEDQISEGLVILDGEGNEFVWVPVNDIERFVRQDGYYNLSIQTLPADSSEPYTKEDYSDELEEYNSMKASVEEHKGFYIGRYEAGSETPRQYYEIEQANGTTKMVVKKDVYVYNFVGWGPGMTITKGDVKSDSDIKQNEGKGAVELSREMYEGSKTVVSHLIYGVEWDAALRFIDPEYTGYARDSHREGNYTKTLKNTGYYALKNIYDMAGNVYEWTMEARSIKYRVVRGADYTYYGYVFPASFRRSEYHNNKSFDGLGFRVSLYVR